MCMCACVCVHVCACASIPRDGYITIDSLLFLVDSWILNSLGPFERTVFLNVLSVNIALIFLGYINGSGTVGP